MNTSLEESVWAAAFAASFESERARCNGTPNGGTVDNISGLQCVMVAETAVARMREGLIKKSLLPTSYAMWRRISEAWPDVSSLLLFRGHLSSGARMMLPSYISDTYDGKYVYLLEKWTGRDSAASVWGLNEWKQVAL